MYQNDVPVYHYHKIVLFIDDVPVQYSEQPTNEVAYIKMMYQSIIITRFVLFLDDVPVQYSEQPTNEVAYIKMMSFLDEVPEEMKLYVPLFTNVITK